MTQLITRPSLVHLRPKSRTRGPVMEQPLPPTSVYLDAEPASGSGLTLPDDAPGSSAAVTAHAAPSPPRKRILVVDNEAASTRLVRLTLERAANAFEVCEVNDSLRALATARRFQPQLILLDIEMPGLDGSAVARQLRQDPALRQVPILFMTSLVTPEEAEANLYAAGSRVLAKPVTLAKLVQSVAEMLSNILNTGAPVLGAAPVLS